MGITTADFRAAVPAEEERKAIHGISCTDQDFGSWRISHIEPEGHVQGHLADVQADFHLKRLMVEDDMLALPMMGYVGGEPFPSRAEIPWRLHPNGLGASFGDQCAAGWEDRPRRGRRSLRTTSNPSHGPPG